MPPWILNFKVIFKVTIGLKLHYLLLKTLYLKVIFHPKFFSRPMNCICVAWMPAISTQCCQKCEITYWLVRYHVENSQARYNWVKNVGLMSKTSSREQFSCSVDLLWLQIDRSFYLVFAGNYEALTVCGR